VLGDQRFEVAALIADAEVGHVDQHRCTGDCFNNIPMACELSGSLAHGTSCSSYRR
jgi:hypothetical protein